MHESDSFERRFQALTGHAPFPWQEALYQRFLTGNIPTSCAIPTGLGKTNVIAVWLIALAQNQKVQVPRRLVYVVNRRTVVDQTTNEVERFRDRLISPDQKAAKPEHVPMLRSLAAALSKRCSQDANGKPVAPLAISTLRGQFADNREWSADPSRPAVICGTVDMIGSRLLFSGYGVGFKGKPLHAGFLGQDALLVHDEAHLEPAFQELLSTIEKEQKRRREFASLRVMELSATSRGAGDVFELTPQEKAGQVSIVRDRLFARKGIKPEPVERAKVAAKVSELALRHKDSNKAVLVFARTIEDVNAVRSKLTDKKEGVDEKQVQLLTGTLRGLERDRLATDDDVFARFLPEPQVKPILNKTVYLVCTSAGEVGVDISADHLVCDLSTLDSMAQRLGRVNRRGGGAAEIDLVYESDPDPKKVDNSFEQARWTTLAHLRQLPACDWIADRLEASPHEIGNLIGSLSDQQRVAAFAPAPTILPATDILFDAWALTSIREKMPGRPAVEPYLHGRSSWEPPETHVAWREEVEVITGDLLAEYRPIDLLDDYPLRPHELLRDATERRNTGVLAQITCIAKRCPDANVWIVDAQGGVSPAKLKDVVEGDSRRLHGATVLLPPCVGGLSAGGMLDGDAEFDEQLKYDVADIDLPNDKRIRVWSNDDAYEAKTAGMRRVCPPIEFPSVDDEDEPRRWEWFESIPQEGGSASNKAVTWQTHVGDVVSNARRIVEGLHLPTDIANAVVLAAELHDHGKRRAAFQTALGNRLYPDVLLAKSGRDGSRLPELFRHEFGSLLDVLATSRARQQAGASSAAPDRSLTVAARTDLEALAAFDKLSDDMQDLALHLIAAHHGRARPHFTLDEIIDIERSSTDAEAMAMETPRRFARLQRKYGRWGLAYLESLLRAADWSASAEPSKVLDAQGKEVTP